MGDRQLFSRLSFNAREHHCLFVNGLNGPNKRFIEAGFPLGLDVDQEGRGVAVADLDQDGRQDLLVRAVARRKLTYFHNDAVAGHFLRVELEGVQSNRDAIGAVVRLRSGGIEQMRTRTAGSGFQGQSEATLHFGLGNATHADRLRIEWPSGRVEQFTNLPADRVVGVVEGRGQLTISLPRGLRRETPAPVETAAMPAWSARDRNGKLWRLPPGKPFLLTFWASWCVPCREEVPALNDVFRKFAGRLGVAGIAIAETEPGAAEQFIQQTKPEYDVLFSSRDQVGAFLDRTFPGGEIGLPSAVLFDRNGTPRRLFRGTIQPRVIERELAAMR